MATYPTLTLKIGLASDPLATSQSFTTVATSSNNRIRSGLIVRGQPGEFDQVAPGTLDIALSNYDRAFDRSNTASPYYPNLRQNKRIRLEATINSTTYALFEGFIDSITQEHDLSGDIVARVRATDGFKMWARARNKNAVYIVEQVGNRLRWVSDNIVGWPSDRRSISANVGVVLASTPANDDGTTRLTGASALDIALECDRTEMGLFYVAGDGTLTFIPRSTLVTGSRHTTSQLTFGDALNGSEVPYDQIIFDDSETQLRNDFQLTSPDFATQQAEDATSITQNGRLSHTVPVAYASKQSMSASAEFLVSQYKDPQSRILGLSLQPENKLGGTYPNTLFPSVLARELGDRVTVKRRPANGSTISQEYWVNQIQHDFTADSWRTTFMFGVAQQSRSWAVWGSSVWGTGQWAH